MLDYGLIIRVSDKFINSFVKKRQNAQSLRNSKLHRPKRYRRKRKSKHGVKSRNNCRFAKRFSSIHLSTSVFLIEVFSENLLIKHYKPLKKINQVKELFLLKLVKLKYVYK